MTASQLSPGEVLPWITRDATGRWTGAEFVTREDAEHAAAKTPGGSVWRDCYATANTDAHRRFVGVAPVVLTPMRRFGAWGDL